MTATSGAGIDRDSRTILRRYYLAMAVPFGIDLMTSAVYAAINAHPLSLLPLTAISAAFLLVGVGMGAWLLIRPIRRFLDGELAFADDRARSREPAAAFRDRRRLPVRADARAAPAGAAGSATPSAPRSRSPPGSTRSAPSSS